MEYFFGTFFILLLVAVLWLQKVIERISVSRHKGGHLHKRNMIYATIAKVFLKDIPD